MKKFLFLLLLLIVSVWLGLFMQSHPGMVVVTFGQTKIQASLWVGLVAMLAVAWGLLLALRLLRLAFGLVPAVSDWVDNRQQRSARKQTLEGLAALLHGDWAKAEKSLVHALKHSDAATLNLMGAAIAAHQQDDLSTRDRLLDKYAASAGEQCYLGAWLKYQSGDHDAALRECEHFLSQHKRNAPAAWWLLKYDCLRDEGDWAGVQQLLPQLKRHTDLSKEILQAVTLEAGYHLLQAYAIEQDHAQLEAFWETLPSTVQHAPLMLSQYAQYCIDSNQPARIEAILTKALKKQQDPDLLALFGQLNTTKNADRIKLVNQWLKTDDNNPDLLRCLARLHAHEALWEQAEHYYQASLTMAPDAETQLELAQIYQTLGRKEDALKCFEAATSA